MEPTAYIRFLNHGFPGQWDRRSFDWYFRREFNGRRTDVAVRAEEGRILAGASYSYRQMVDPSGRTVDVCVMGTATTLPSERGRGHYATLLQTGIDLCHERSCAALLGFATADNPSGRAFMRRGAHSIPSYYIASAAGARARLRHPRPMTELPAIDAKSRCESREQPSQVRFVYARPRDWAQQFVERPCGVRVVRVAHDCTALIETVGSIDRLQWLRSPDRKVIAGVARLAAASAAAGRRFFMYTMDSLLACSAGRLGLGIRDGVVLVLPADRGGVPLDELLQAPWRLQSGDRM